MSVIEFPSIPPWLTRYHEKGLKIIFYDAKSKIPKDQDWPTRVYGLEDYIPGQNVGLILGTEVSPGRFGADVDFDWVPGIALSPGILPKTQCGFGHPPSKPISHALYTTPSPVVTKKYTNVAYDPDDLSEHLAKSKQCFVELRGVKESGELGFQTMIPPSVWIPEEFRSNPDGHPGEQLVYRTDGEWGHSEELPRRVLLYAIACLLHANIPHGTFKHEMRLACAGFLIKGCSLNREEATAVMHSVVASNGPHDRGDELAAIDSTLRKINAKQAVMQRREFVEAIGRYGDRVVSQIVKWIGGSEFIESKGRILANQENIRRAMDIAGIRFSYDEFSGKPMVLYPGDGGRGYEGEVEDNIRRKIWLEVERKYHFLPPKQLHIDVTDDMAFENRYHPVVDYLTSLKWDGVPRIDTWVIRSADAMDTPYVRAVSSIMLMAAVRRVTKPGCKYDEMVIFESGKQGLLKSSALRTLCPKDDWFSDNLPLNLKAQELIELTSGKWIIEVAELNKIKAAQIDHIKSLLSRQDDTARLAYRHDPKTQRRQSIFVGTTNSYTYLTDQTGNRRFWPIRVKKFDVEWIRENRDQIWAEAYTREQAGESIRLPEELYRPAEIEQENRLVDDEWRNILDQYFAKQYLRIAYDEIWEQLAVPVERRNPASTQRVAEIMQSLGFSKASTVRDRSGKVSKGWKRDDIHSDEEWAAMRDIRPEDEDNSGLEKL